MNAESTFNNNVDGIERATRLIMDICGGECGPTDDTVAQLPPRRPVRMRVARARKVIGVPVGAEDMADIFRRLNLAFRRDGAGAEEVFLVTPPSYRFDIEIEEDLIEEVARLYGFERIPAHPPVAPTAMLPLSGSRRSLHDLRLQMAAAEYQEVVNYSFVDASWEADFAGNDDPIRLLNPIASQMAVMRSTLIGGLVATVAYNLNRKLERVRVFEMGRAFLRDPAVRDGELDVAGIRQPMRVAAVAYGSADEEQWGVVTRAVDFFDVKNDLETLIAPRRVRFDPVAHPALHPGRGAQVILDDAVIGWIGELHPKWQKKYGLPEPLVALKSMPNRCCRLLLPQYHEVSRFPPVRRDMSFSFDENLPVQAILDGLLRAKPAIVHEVRVFDVYRGKGHRKREKRSCFPCVIARYSKDTNGCRGGRRDCGSAPGPGTRIRCQAETIR